MQQRASIARALAFDPDLLLMDEPFGALDEIVRDKLNEQLLRLWDKTRKTVVFVTHSIPEAVFLSTRIVVMSPRPGRIHDVIDCGLPRDRTLEIRETPEFLEIAHRVRARAARGPFLCRLSAQRSGAASTRRRAASASADPRRRAPSIIVDLVRRGVLHEFALAARRFANAERELTRPRTSSKAR